MLKYTFHFNFENQIFIVFTIDRTSKNEKSFAPNYHVFLKWRKLLVSEIKKSFCFNCDTNFKQDLQVETIQNYKQNQRGNQELQFCYN